MQDKDTQLPAGYCIFCVEEGRQTPINVDRDYNKVTGFERKRAQGGTNALRLRQPHDEWACWACIEKRGRGLAGQEPMFF